MQFTLDQVNQVRMKMLKFRRAAACINVTLVDADVAAIFGEFSDSG